ncbi:MAG TPA: PmoA family protein [Tangfeifania sp.]|nr:PmoA family protein [Tangfeifania sp.]
MKHQILLTLLPVVCSLSLNAQVTLQKEEGGLLFLEDGEKVLFYQSEPKSIDGKYERTNYIHPLWGIDGAVLTEDFPADHLHHRGIFWAWHQVWINGKRIGDPWELKNFDLDVSEIEFFMKSNGTGVLKTEVKWKSDQWIKLGKKAPYLQENTKITIHPENRNFRRIDFEISLLSLEEELKIGGSEDEKGYSGFSVRLKLPDDVEFTGSEGEVEPQTTAVESKGFINISGSMAVGGKKSGVVIVDHPENPGYPQPWILRAKNSMQNAAWPGNKTIPVSTTGPLVLKYSLIVYSGRMNERKICRIMDDVMNE